MTTPDFTPIEASTEIPDFTPTGGVKFTLYGELYLGTAELTLEDSFSYESLSKKLGDTTLSVEQRIESMRTILRTLLEPDSAERLITKLSDRQKPVGLRTTNEIFKYIMGEYGERPTTPGSDSSAGSDDPESGTRSTESSSPEA